jgi:hypothetical protein
MVVMVVMVEMVEMVDCAGFVDSEVLLQGGSITSN